MDMSLVVIDQENNQLQFAGANNPMYLIRDGELHSFTPDKMPVGIYAGNSKPFTNHIIDIQEGDILYIFSDGYADQFGGYKGKKFMYKKFKELIYTNSVLTMEEQKQSLDKAITDWMLYNNQPFEQVDDITVVGIRI